MTNDEMKTGLPLLLLAALMALPACTATYTEYGVNPNSPEARTWIEGIVAVEKINDAFDKSHHLNAYR